MEALLSDLLSCVSKLFKQRSPQKLVGYHASTPPPNPYQKKNLVLDPPLMLFIGGSSIRGFLVDRTPMERGGGSKMKWDDDQ